MIAGMVLMLAFGILIGYMIGSRVKANKSSGSGGTSNPAKGEQGNQAY